MKARNSILALLVLAGLSFAGDYHSDEPVVVHEEHVTVVNHHDDLGVAVARAVVGAILDIPVEHREVVREVVVERPAREVVVVEPRHEHEVIVVDDRDHRHYHHDDDR